MKIDHWYHIELVKYLMSLKGILKVHIENDDLLEIYIKYNPNLIPLKTIKLEILLFLDILNIPSIVAFDKHSNNKISNYQIVRNSICCEYCFKGAIEELLEINGIEKVESNFDDENYWNNNFIINIKYNNKLISFDDLKQLETKLNI